MNLKKAATCTDAHSRHGQRSALTDFFGQTYILYLFMYCGVISQTDFNLRKTDTFSYIHTRTDWLSRPSRTAVEIVALSIFIKTVRYEKLISEMPHVITLEI